jgi:putative ABC transport system substrate-binding protein
VAAGFACLLTLGGAGRANGHNIAVVAGDTLTYTHRAISGAKRVISEKDGPVDIRVFYLAPGPGAQACEDSIRQFRPDVILTIGSAATSFAKERFTTVPIVFSAVLYPAISGFVESETRPGRNITGASLDIPADIQFKYFRRIIPDLRSIGVLYTTNTTPLISQSKVLAEEMGLTLVPIRIEDPKDIPRALDSLANTVDGLWSVADPNLFGPQSTKYILLNSLRKGIPFMGFSRYVVESGALFALDFDYKAIGRQAGEIVNRVLDGTDPGSISITHPDIIWFHYNEKTAEHLQLSLPTELVAIAKEVYR